MSIESALTATHKDVENARATIVAMGGTVTPNGGTSQLSADIATIPQGGDLPPLSNPATAADMLRGKDAIDGNGNKIIGMLQCIRDETVELQENAFIDVDGNLNIELESMVDSSQAVILQPVPDARPENILAGKNILGVVGTAQGGGAALINGRKFECGTFTFPSAMTSSYTIQHTLGKEPSAVFLWVVDPDYSVRGQVGKFRADATSIFNSVSITAVNSAISTGLGGGGTRYRTEWSSSTITFDCDSLYPLLPNVEYQWLAIA